MDYPLFGGGFFDCGPLAKAMHFLRVSVAKQEKAGRVRQP